MSMQNFTAKKLCAVLVGNLILGIGVAMLRISGMGNDPFCAANMALSDGLGVGLGNFQLAVNIVLLIAQVIWGRKYLGIGSVVNLFLLGYITQFAGIGLERLLGDVTRFGLAGQLAVMVIALFIVTFGLAMYQTADLGVAPYDYLSIGMTDRLPTPYFVNRVITDSICVVIILLALLVKLIGWEMSHLGVGTILCAFCLGPLVNLFSKVHKKWIE